MWNIISLFKILVIVDFIVAWIGGIKSDVKKSRKNKNKNVLLIMYDDLRPELSSYGRSHMSTPHFQKLSERSVTFDNAFCQISVCNPSRDSMLTGLRPDTIGTYAFDWTHGAHMIIPKWMKKSGYNTAGYGKVLHWDEPNPDVWSYDFWGGDWYEYQNRENNFMNASTQPDKARPEEWFKDYNFTTSLINSLKYLRNRPEYFMAAIGFKLPHLALHIPYKYYAMYQGKEKMWALQKKELRYPPTAPGVSYRCCAYPSFDFLKSEGSVPFDTSIELGASMDFVVPTRMHDELMRAYCGAVSYLDAQLGRILSAIDELKLWNNLTIILTSDHGIHNGEKGLWEKWTLFDESTRVPLMIYHPDSPFKGQHYRHPVELIDIFPTILELSGAKTMRKDVCEENDVCFKLQGKSLAPVVLGDVRSLRVRAREGRTMTIKNKMRHVEVKNSGDHIKVSVKKNTRENRRLLTFGNSGHGSSQSLLSNVSSLQMPKLTMDFAITQLWRCAKYSDLGYEFHARKLVWFDCSIDDNFKPERYEQFSVMGYSMRTLEFRYTVWLHFNRTSMISLWDRTPFEEELYDHREDKLGDFPHFEIYNLASKSAYSKVIYHLRTKLLNFLKRNVLFHGPYPEPINEEKNNGTQEQSNSS